MWVYILCIYCTYTQNWLIILPRLKKITISNKMRHKREDTKIPCNTMGLQRITKEYCEQLHSKKNWIT